MSAKIKAKKDANEVARKAVRGAVKKNAAKSRVVKVRAAKVKVAKNSTSKSVTNDARVELIGSSSIATHEFGANSGAKWTFLTNHSHVLICLAREPELRLRDVAARVGITERAVQRIVADLEEATILTRSRDGRRNRYEVHAGQPLRHAIEAHCSVSDLLKIVEVDEMVATA